MTRASEASPPWKAAAQCQWPGLIHFFLIYLDNGDFSLYSVNSPDIFPMLTGEGDLIDQGGFMCIADHTYENEGVLASFGYGYKVDTLARTQEIYKYSSKTETWKFAHQNFIEMLENLNL